MSVLLASVFASFIMHAADGAASLAYGSLRGVALAAEGRPLGSVSVVFRSADGATDRRAVSDSDGVIAVESLKPGPYQITASRKGMPGPAVPGRARIHTDNSVGIKYFDRPFKKPSKMAFSFTGDLGCEFGGGVSCHGDTAGGPKQSFVGFMFYNRRWCDRDRCALTLGGGVIHNPRRYLVRRPPINGMTASSAAINSPYFTENPGDPFKARDVSGTFDYMPRQWLTRRFGGDFRHANVPYWSGAGGITPPPGSNNGFPTESASLNGAPSPTIAGCAGNGGLWLPDLRRREFLIDIDLLVKF